MGIIAITFFALKQLTWQITTSLLHTTTPTYSCSLTRTPELLLTGEFCISSWFNNEWGKKKKEETTTTTTTSNNASEEFKQSRKEC